MEQIIEYLKQKFNPLTIIVYGSYANGTNNQNSDFDALVVSYDYQECHDTSFVGDIQLDVFVYPLSYFTSDYDCGDFIRIFDGKIIEDKDQIGKAIKDNVIKYLNNLPRKTTAEIQSEIDWCVKMLQRSKRGDAEGMFRWHWLLTDSLEIFCDVVNHRYFGPKKSLIWMKENYPDAFERYEKALNTLNIENLENWIIYLKNLNT